MIAIKTMNEMPRNCLACPAFDNCEDCEGYMNTCGITNEDVGYIHDEPKIMIDKRPDSCPLIKIPDKNPKVRVVEDALGGHVCLVYVNVPFVYCKSCERLEIEEIRHYANNEVVDVIRTCKNEGICRAHNKAIVKHTGGDA